MIINAISQTIKKIWKLLLFILVAFIIIILTLKEGIRVETISLPFVKVTQFYIKLDKKLIVNAKDVTIKSTKKEQTSYEEFITLTEYLPFINGLFDSISIQNLSYENNTIHFLYKNDIFYIDSKYLTLDSSISSKQKLLTLHVKEFILKDFDTLLKGKVEIDLKNDKYQFDGEYSISNLSGNATLLLEHNNLFYRIDSKEMETIEPFMEFLNTKVEIEPQINDWVYKNIVAKKYRIEKLEGLFDIKTFDYYPTLIKAIAHTQDIQVRFNPLVAPAHAKEVDVILENDTLTFLAKQASYQGKIVHNPNVYIYNLLNKGSGIIVDIKSNSILDNDIHNILKAFHIDIPLTQTSGTTSSSLILDVDFDPVGIRSVNGVFEFDNADIDLAGLHLYSQKGLIKLENTLITLDDVHMKYQELFDLHVSGDLNLSTLLFQGSTKLESINIDLGKQNLLHVKDKTTDVSFEIKENATEISLHELYTKLIFEKKTSAFIIEDLSAIKQYAPLLQSLDIKEGNATISTQNFKDFIATAKLKNIETPLYKNGLHVKDLNLSINTDGEKFQASALEDKLRINFDKTLKIMLKDLDIQTSFASKESSFKDFDVSVEGISSNILDKNSTKKILNDKFLFKLTPTTMAFKSTYKKSSLDFEKSDEYLYIDSDKMPSDYINAIIGKKVFENGKFHIYIDGKNEENLNGLFFMHDATIKDLKFFNNLMAFINTIPSLATFKNPKFNEKGYEVQDGFINFTRKGNTLAIDDIKLKGYSADISGKGVLFLDTDRLNLELQISTLKSISGAIKNIPILKDIILGEDGRIYTNISVKGTLEQPEISTNIITDTILTPVNIIKRTIQLPFKIFK